eukprot:1143708-Pelagomonas_calceolata.AAC.6
MCVQGLLPQHFGQQGMQHTHSTITNLVCARACACAGAYEGSSRSIFGSGASSASSRGGEALGWAAQAAVAADSSGFVSTTEGAIPKESGFARDGGAVREAGGKPQGEAGAAVEAATAAATAAAGMAAKMGESGDRLPTEAAGRTGCHVWPCVAGGALSCSFGCRSCGGEALLSFFHGWWQHYEGQGDVRDECCDRAAAMQAHAKVGTSTQESLKIFIS